MKKIIMIILVLMITVGLFAACGGSGGSSSQSSTMDESNSSSGSDTSDTQSSGSDDAQDADKSIDDVANEIIDALGFNDMMSVTPSVVEVQHKIYTDEIADEAVVYLHATGIIADEIFILKLKDGADVDKLIDGMGAYIIDRIGQYEGYAPEEVPKLENAQIVQKGNYIMMLIAEDPSAGAEVFEKSFN